MLGADDAGLTKHFGSDRGLTERSQPFQIHDVEFFAEDVGKTAFGHAAMKRHLAAFKTAHHARTAARPLAFVSARGGFAHAGTHAAANALFARVRLFRCSNIRQIHNEALSLQLSATARSRPDAESWPPFHESRDCRDAQSPGSAG